MKSEAHVNVFWLRFCIVTDPLLSLITITKQFLRSHRSLSATAKCQRKWDRQWKRSESKKSPQTQNGSVEPRTTPKSNFRLHASLRLTTSMSSVTFASSPVLKWERTAHPIVQAIISHFAISSRCSSWHTQFSMRFEESGWSFSVWVRLWHRIIWNSIATNTNLTSWFISSPAITAYKYIRGNGIRFIFHLNANFAVFLQHKLSISISISMNAAPQ